MTQSSVSDNIGNGGIAFVIIGIAIIVTTGSFILIGPIGGSSADGTGPTSTPSSAAPSTAAPTATPAPTPTGAGLNISLRFEYEPDHVGDQLTIVNTGRELSSLPGELLVVPVDTLHVTVDEAIEQGGYDALTGSNSLANRGSAYSLGSSYAEGDVIKVVYVPDGSEGDVDGEYALVDRYVIPSDSNLERDGPDGDTDGDGVSNRNDTYPLDPEAS